MLLVGPAGGVVAISSSGPTITRHLVLCRRASTAIAIHNSGSAPTEHPTISTMSVVLLLLDPLGESGGGDSGSSGNGGGDGGNGGDLGGIVMEVMQ